MRSPLVLCMVVFLDLFAQFGVARAQGDTDARVWFERGRTAYDAGQFAEAAAAFRRSYVLSARHQLLYNIGQSELRAGRDPQALEAFEAFLRQASAADGNREEVEERVRVLRSMGVSSAPPPAASEPAAVVSTEPALEDTSPPPSVNPPVEVDQGPGFAPWIVVGSGAALVVAGAVLVGLGLDASWRVTGATEGARWSDLEGAASSANVLFGVGIGLSAAGLAAVGAGVGWALSASSPSSEGVSARVHIGPGTLHLRGEF